MEYPLRRPEQYVTEENGMTMIVTGNYYTQIIDEDNQNILADDNYVLRADWKGVTT